MTNVMVDLETLGTRSNSVILSIGAVFFEPKDNTLGREFYAQIRLSDSLERGMQVDASTILWWMSQKDDARNAFLNNEERGYALRLVLGEFNEFFCLDGNRDNIKIWGNGADFDCALLKDAYELCKLTPPWKYYNTRDLRTIKEFYNASSFSAEEIKRFEPLTKHNALEDAKAEARLANVLLGRLYSAIGR
jgi:hypothetical protein